LSSPAASDVFCINALAAPFTVHTIPDKTVLAFADHGSVGELMAADGGDAEEVLAKITKAGIDYEMLGTDLQQESAESFVKDWNEMLASITSKRAACKAAAQLRLLWRSPLPEYLGNGGRDVRWGSGRRPKTSLVG
jgi:transaldolase